LEDYTAALSAVASIPVLDQDISSSFIKAFARAQMGDTAEVLRHFDQVLMNVANPVVIANSQCLIADSYSIEGYKTLAREYYSACEEMDSEGNYWAVMGLGGG